MRVDGGFSIVELLAALGIASVALTMGMTLLAAGRYFMQMQTQHIETVQALRATIDTMTRDLRLSGACLPVPQGSFSPVTAGNNGATDTFTTRAGLVQPNLMCAQTYLTANAAANATSLTVNSTSGFQVGMGGYIFNPVNLSGQDFNIVSASGTTVVSDTAMNQTYSSASGSAALVYAVDRRTYAIDSTTNPNVPVLTVTINGGTAQPFASGITSLNIQYRLFRNCPPCDTLDSPGSSDWPLLNEFIVNVTARSQLKNWAGNYYSESAQFIAKPRNLIPISAS